MAYTKTSSIRSCNDNITLYDIGPYNHPTRIDPAEENHGLSSSPWRPVEAPAAQTAQPHGIRVWVKKKLSSISFFHHRKRSVEAEILSSENSSSARHSWKNRLETGVRRGVRALEFTNAVILWGISFGTFHEMQTTPIAPGQVLPQSSVLTDLSTASNALSISGPIIELGTAIRDFWAWLSYKRTNKTNKESSRPSIPPPKGEKHPIGVGERFNKNRSRVLLARAGISLWSFVRRIPELIQGTLAFLGVAAGSLVLPIIALAIGVPWSIAFLVKDNRVVRKTKAWLAKVKDFKVNEGTFLAKIKNLQLTALKEKILNKRIRMMIIGAILPFIITSSLLTILGVVTFGGFPAIILLILILMGLGYFCTQSIIGHAAKKKLKKERLVAEQEINALIQQEQAFVRQDRAHILQIEELARERANVRREISLCKSDSSRQVGLGLQLREDEEIRLTKHIRIISRQRAALREDIESKQNEIKEKQKQLEERMLEKSPSEALKVFLQKITTKQATPEELKYLRSCFDEKKKTVQNKEEFFAKLKFIFTRKKEKIEEMEFEKFLQELHKNRIPWGVQQLELLLLH